MNKSEKFDSVMTPQNYLDTMIRLGVIAFVVFLSVQVFAPFALIMLWALVLSIMIYPIHQKLAKKMDGKQGRAASLIVLGGCLLIGVPTIMLGFSFLGHVTELMAAFRNDSLSIVMPSSEVKEWPLVGGKIYSVWAQAASDLPGFFSANSEQIVALFRKLFAVAGGVAGFVFLFVGALIISGIMMAWGEEGSAAMLRIANRVSGASRGARLQSISVATVRSVATGVVGVAFVQAILLGIGFLLAGIPAAGILAVISLLLGIMQIPAALVAVPAMIYIWSAGGGSVAVNIGLSVYLVVAALADNVLKPMLLGKGVAVPMPVILIGALGGMVTMGLLGLFLGSSLLAVGYRVFMDWVDAEDFVIPEPGESGTAVADQ